MSAAAIRHALGSVGRFLQWQPEPSARSWAAQAMSKMGSKTAELAKISSV